MSENNSIADFFDSLGDASFIPEEFAQTEDEQSSPAIEAVDEPKVEKKIKSESKETPKKPESKKPEEPRFDENEVKRLIETNKKPANVPETPQKSEESSYYEDIYLTFLEKAGYELEDGETLNINSEEDLDEALGGLYEQIKSTGYKTELAKELDEYISAGGKPEDFFQKYTEVDYESYPNEIDMDDAKNIIYDYCKKYQPKLSDKDIVDYINFMQSKGDEYFEKTVFDYLDKLKDGQKEEKRELIENQKRLQEQRRKEEEASWNNIYSTIMSAEKIGGQDVSKKDKENFFKYIYEKDKDGKTAYQKSLENPNSQIELAFLSFSGINKNAVIKQARTEVTRSFRNLLLRSNTQNHNGFSPKPTNTEPESLEEFFDNNLK